MLSVAERQQSELDLWFKKIESIGFTERLSISAFKAIFQKYNIQKNFYLITVTGTNGKGSTCHLLSNILKNAGYRVGLFTSPHIFKFNERIKINDQPILDVDLLKYFQIISQIEKESPIPFGFFTYAFLIACFYFNDHSLDFVILEVGCGGRLDPSNAFDCDMLGITSIGLDHQAMLGNTRELIALEKSALARENHPVIIGEKDFPQEAFLYLKKIKAEIINPDLKYDNNYKKPPFLHSNNLSIVLALIEKLKEKQYVFDKKIIQQTIKNFQLNGRCQSFEIKANFQLKNVIFDVGHNEQSFIYLIDFLKQKYGDDQQFSVLYSTLLGKKTDDIFNCFKDLNIKWHLTSLENIDNRAMPLNEIKASCDKYTSISKVEKNPINLFESMINLDSNDVIIVCGSFILVSKIMSYCKEKGYIDDSMLF